MVSVYVTVDQKAFDALRQAADMHNVTVAALLRGAAKTLSDNFTDMDKLVENVDTRRPGKPRRGASNDVQQQ